MISDAEHELMNRLTDTDNRGHYNNPYLRASYIPLPNSMCKTCDYLITELLDPVRYERGGVKEGYDYISTTKPLTIDDILLNTKSLTYHKKGNRVATDRKNFKPLLKDLHAYNIFYMWECSKFLIFIMERDIRCWKIYNDLGCVTPKTLIKIIERADGIIDDMVRFHVKARTTIKIDRIESSFGVFINTMVDKMYHLVSAGLPKWDKKRNINEYLEELSEELEKLRSYDGLDESRDYIDKLPPFVRGEILKIKGGNGMNSDLEKEVVPVGKAASTAKPRRKKRQKKEEKKKGSTPSVPQQERFNESINPFEDGDSFTKYYRASLANILGTTNIRFDTIECDRAMGLEIIDLLRTHNRQDKSFVNAWIKNFVEVKLKGEKCLKSKYTSMRAFRNTFERYRETHYDGN
jgi:hypothetical protein